MTFPLCKKLGLTIKWYYRDFENKSQAIACISPEDLEKVLEQAPEVFQSKQDNSPKWVELKYPDSIIPRKQARLILIEEIKPKDTAEETALGHLRRVLSGRGFPGIRTTTEIEMWEDDINKARKFLEGVK